jgi:hypothetical protein
MPLYEYEALNYKGKEIKGLIECSNEHEASEKLRDMGYSPQRIVVSGINIRTGYEKTTAIKVSKAIAGICVIVLFCTTAIFVLSFPSYWKLVNLEGQGGLVTEAGVMEVSISRYVEDSNPRVPASYNISYVFEVNGKSYEGAGYWKADKNGKAGINKGDVLKVRYSLEYPSINRIKQKTSPDSTRTKRTLMISGIISTLLVLIVFFASSWEHFLNYKKLSVIDTASAAIESKRITINFFSALLFPLIFACMFALLHSQDKDSIYHNYIPAIILAIFIFAAIAIYLNKLSSKAFPIYIQYE